MLWKIVFGVLLLTLLAILCWRLRGAALTPVRPGAHVRVQVLLWVDGAAPELEQAVKGLQWLRANDTLPAELVVIDRGMDPATAAVAAALEKQGTVKVVN